MMAKEETSALPKVRSIKVEPGDLVNKGKKSYRNYKITLKVPVKTDNQWQNAKEYSLIVRFSSLHGANSLLNTRMSSNFPKKNRLFDYTHNMKNVSERAQQLEKYLKIVFRDQSGLTNQKWQQRIGFSESQSAEFMNLAREIENYQMEMENQSILQEQERGRYWEEGRRSAQIFHRNISENAEIPVVLTFNRPVKFQLTYEWATNKILGPDERDWFIIKRPDFLDLNGVFVITTLSGDPLATFERIKGQLTSIHCKISKNTADNRFEWCEVYRHAGSSCSVNKIAAGCPNIIIDGDWGSFICKETSILTCKSAQEYSLLNEIFEVTIQPGVDVILYLAISIAIETLYRHHHE